MGFSESLAAVPVELWLVFGVGFMLFAVFFAGRAAAARAGRHLGVSGVGLVVVVVAALLWWAGSEGLGLLVGFVGVVLVLAGLKGKSR